MSTNAVTTALTAEQARRLTDEIKVALEMTWDLVVQAYTSQAWAPLGYASWSAYCEGEFHASRLRLPLAERTEVVAVLADAGMSIREIAAATGESKSTIGRELSPPVPNGTARRRLSDDEVWAIFLEGGNPAPLLGVEMTDAAWSERLARARAEDEALPLVAFEAYAAMPEVFEAAITMCRAIGDLSRERLSSVLLAALPREAIAR